MADLSEEILAGRDSPRLYARHFDDPRFGYVIVVLSIPGPWGSIRPITTNGNHRSMAFDARESPLVLAEVHDQLLPYRITYNEDNDDWKTTRNFLTWQEARGALRWSSRPIVRQGRHLELRIADAATPWLVPSPRDAFAALDAYERFWGNKLETVGPLDVAELRRTWRSAARRNVREPLVAEIVSTTTLVAPPVGD